MNAELLRLKEQIDFEVKMSNELGVRITSDKLMNYYREVSSIINSNPLAKLINGHSTIANNKFTKLLKDTPYLSLIEVSINKPRGLKQNMLQYGLFVKTLVKGTATLNERMITPFYEWVSIALANPTKLAQISDLEKLKPLNIDIERKRIADYVTVSSDVTTGKYGDLLQANREWVEICDCANDLMKDLASKTIQNLDVKIEDLQKITNNLIVLISDKKQELKLSSKSIDIISETLYQIAQEVEHHATVMHLANAYIVCVENNYDRLDEIINA